MAKASDQQASSRGPAAATTPAAAASRATPDKPAAAALRYVDRPELAETFADSISSLLFDGQLLRIEFAVTRLDEITPNTPIAGRRYPACRVVLSPSGALDLINRIQQITAALRQAVMAKRAPPAGETAD